MGSIVSGGAEDLVELRLINSDKATINLGGRFVEVVRDGTVKVPAEVATQLMTQGFITDGGLINRWWPADEPVPDMSAGHNPGEALKLQQARHTQALAEKNQIIEANAAEMADLREQLARANAAIAQSATAVAAKEPAPAETNAPDLEENKPEALPSDPPAVAVAPPRTR